MKAKLGLILGILNTVAVLAALGTLVYTKLIFKPPPITEHGERKRLEKIKEKPVVSHEKGQIIFEAFTTNIGSDDGKLHYISVGFQIEIRDKSKLADIESLKSLINDSVMSILGKKKYMELTNVQGRYNLKNEILETTNPVLIRKGLGSDIEPPLTDVFFTQFIVN